MSYIKHCLDEIARHNAPGYHTVVGRFDEQAFGRLDFPVSMEYREFVSHIGYGVFFGGQLRLFGPKESDNDTSPGVDVAFSSQGKRLLLVGNNGTTEGVFCIDELGRVVWLFDHDREVRDEGTSFAVWVDRKFKELFVAKTYTFYSSITDPIGAISVIKERKRFSVTLSSFEKDLVKEPGNAKAILPRYNRLFFSVKGPSDSSLEYYTVKCQRAGSVYSDMNVEYVSIPLRMRASPIQVFLFDPFNVEFKEIIADCSADIDLLSKMRTKYRELSPYI